MSPEIDKVQDQLHYLHGLKATSRVTASFNMTPRQWMSLLRASKRAIPAAATFVRQFTISHEITKDKEFLK